MSDEQRLMTQAEYAAHRGCSQPYVSKLVRAGRIPTGDKGKIDPVAADEALAASADPGSTAGAAARKAAGTARGGGKRAADAPTKRPRAPEQPGARKGADPATLSANASFTAARAQRETALAKQAEADYRKSIGELVEAAAVQRAISDCAVSTRQLVMQIPNRIATKVAAEFGVDPSRLYAVMQSEIERVCVEVADTAKAIPERLAATSQ